MIFQHLVYLTALARERHFGRAAASCHVSQATLSAAIRRLEADLGGPLVHRGHRFEGLTPEGERAVHWARRILADCDSLRADVAALREGVAGRLRIGAIPTSLPIVTQLTGALRERHAGLALSVRSLSSRAIARGLEEGELDLGVTYLANEPLRGVRARPLYDERYLFVAPSDGPYARRATIAWSEAAQAPLCLLSSDMQNRRIVERSFQEAGAVPQPVVETNSISTLHAYVRDERLCTVMADTWLRGFGIPAGMRAIPLVEPAARQSIGLVWLDREPVPVLVDALVESIAELDLDAFQRPPRGP